jgi:hypothetical protein
MVIVRKRIYKDLFRGTNILMIELRKLQISICCFKVLARSRRYVRVVGFVFVEYFAFVLVETSWVFLQYDER